MHCLWYCGIHFPNSFCRKNILGRVLFHNQVIIDLPDHILPFKLVIAEQEVITGFNKTLEENQVTNSSVKLTTKHTLLTTIVSVHTLSLVRIVAKTLGAHRRNIISVIS